MMKKTIFYLSLVLVVIVLGCRERGIKGSGTVVTETREIKEFDELEVSGAYNLEIEVGSDVSMEIIAEDNLLKYIKTEVINDRLIIETSRSISPKRKIRIVLTTPELQEIESSGISNIYVNGIDEQNFNLDLSGAGFIELKGKVEQFNAELSGAGRLEARELYARFVDIETSGASFAEVYASEKLTADLSGMGNIDYFGDVVEVDSNISGVGKLTKRE